MEKMPEINPSEGKDKLQENKFSVLSLKRVFSAVKDGFLNNIRMLFGREQEDPKSTIVLKSFFKDMNETKALSEDAGQFFQELIPNSLRKPNQEYQEDKKLNGIAYVEWLRSEFTGEIARDNIQDSFHSEVREEAEEGKEQIKQRCYNRYKREDGFSVAEEAINNILTDEMNMALSYLAATDLKTGQRLDLSQLLPSGCYFSPASMVKRHERLNRDGDRPRIEIIPIPQDLKAYTGVETSENHFYSRGNMVAYGDLTEKGGILSLLHEISHAWQGKYYEQLQIHSFEEFYSGTVSALSLIKEFKENVAKGNGSSEDNDFAIDFLKDDLLKKGVQIDEDNFVYQGQEVKNGEILVADPMGNKYIIKSERAAEVANGYGQDERDAWAHALKTLRYLRRRGIDLEPGMKTLSDFQEYIGPCLESHQKHIEKQITLSNESILRFNRFGKK